MRGLTDLEMKIYALVHERKVELAINVAEMLGLSDNEETRMKVNAAFGVLSNRKMIGYSAEKGWHER